MSERTRISRRGFLGGSAAVVAGSWSTGLFGSRVEAQAVAPPVALPLDQLTTAGAVDEAFWVKVRSQFNLVDGFTFMNTGTYGPSPRVVVDANDRLTRELAETRATTTGTPSATPYASG